MNRVYYKADGPRGGYGVVTATDEEDGSLFVVWDDGNCNDWYTPGQVVYVD